MIKKQFLLSIILILIPALAFSGVVGKISGTVKDANGDPLIGVNIVLEGTYQGAASDVNGEYYIINIQPGKYTVKASAVGYSDVRITDVQVIPDHTSNVDFVMESEVIQGQTVTITAERPLIQKDATFSASVTTAEEIENMPVNTFTEVLSLSSGVIVDEFNNSSEIHLRGGRASELTYMVDGIYVTDPHDGAVAADVVSQGIQDLSIVSGTFNAEYGDAMSGVVNIVTKEGTSRYSGVIRLSTNDRDILGSDYNNGTRRMDATISGPLPFFGDRGSFFLSGDNLSTDTYLRTATSNVHDIAGNPLKREHDFLTFHNRERYTGKIVIRPINALKFVIGYNHTSEQQRNYDDSFKEIPDHKGINYDRSQLFHATMTHTLGPRTFYNIRFSRFITEYKYELTSDRNSITTPLFVGDAFDGTSNYEFYGDYLSHVDYDTTFYTPDSFDVAIDSVWVTSDDDEWEHRKSWTTTLSADITSQIHKNHLVKMGLEYKQYRIKQDYLSGVNEKGVGNHREETHYDMEPVKFSAYIQDKMEFKQFIINLGLRFDLLDPRADYAPDLEAPMDLKPVSSKSKFSPRIGFAFPVTENIRFHFAYGHFFRFAEFHKLYRRFNSQDPVGLVNVTQGYRPRLGNPNLDPETTIAYEFGTQIALAADIAAGVTFFYRDTYDYIATKFYDSDPRPYFAIVNLDYANAKGVEFKLEKRFSNHFRAQVNYTYSRTEGNADDYMTHFMEYQNASVNGQIIPKKTVTLDWDQPHTISFQFDYRWHNNWGINFVGTFGSGFPYTPTDARGKHIGEINSARRPWTGTVGARVNKDFQFFGFRQTLFANIWNLFDKKNVYNVYTDTGKPDFTTNPNASEEAMHNPHWYGAPRRIEIGLQVGF